MATVYKAFDAQLERDVAIKVILRQKQSSEKLLARFKREAKALANSHIPTSSKSWITVSTKARRISS